LSTLGKHTKSKSLLSFKMFFKSLSLGVVCLSFLLQKVSAQYINHHQQVFYFEQQDRKVWNTKALTPVTQRNVKKYKWTFASTINAEGNKNTNILLTKLRENLPVANAFDWEWSKEYGGQDISIDVMDVVHEARDGSYILCGRVQFFEKRRFEAFLFRVDSIGFPVLAKTYREFSVFNSVTPAHNGRGYIAVGQTQFSENPDILGRDAAYVSVKKSNLNIKCAKFFQGTFRQTDSNGIDDGFNKVIKYAIKKPQKRKLYAVVGETRRNINFRCRQNSDVLVLLADDKCNVEWVKQYGSHSDVSDTEINERGLSLAQFDKKTGGLVITGNTEAIDSCVQKRFDDVLAFVVKPDGTLDWMGHYDLDPLLDVSLFVRSR